MDPCPLFTGSGRRGWVGWRLIRCVMRIVCLFLVWCLPMCHFQSPQSTWYSLNSTTSPAHHRSFLQPRSWSFLLWSVCVPLPHHSIHIPHHSIHSVDYSLTTTCLSICLQVTTSLCPTTYGLPTSMCAVPWMDVKLDVLSAGFSWRMFKTPQRPLQSR